MSFITHLFSHHRETKTLSSASIQWPGQSGTEYQYEIHSIDTSFQPLPGNYIYAYKAEDGTWIPIYIAQTRGLHQRLEGHVKMEDAIAYGATHIHVHYCALGQATRCNEERDLVLHWKPVCNDPIES